MKVALLLITHNKIATSMMDIVSSIFNYEPANLACIEIPMDASLTLMKANVARELEQLDTQDGVLILTDIYGGTPSNIAGKFSEEDNIKMVCGLNLPMLVRIMNYRTLPLYELIEIAIDGGKDGIALCKKGTS